MKFKANKTDLDLELTLLDGTEILIEYKEALNAAKAQEMLTNFINMEDTFATQNKKKQYSVMPFDQVAIILSTVYDKDREWWVNNFDGATLHEIYMHVLSEIKGLKKKEMT